MVGVCLSEVVSLCPWLYSGMQERRKGLFCTECLKAGSSLGLGFQAMYEGDKERAMSAPWLTPCSAVLALSHGDEVHHSLAALVYVGRLLSIAELPPQLLPLIEVVL